MARDRTQRAWGMAAGLSIGLMLLIGASAGAQDNESHQITITPESVDGGEGERVTTPPLELKVEVKPPRDPDAPLPSLEEDASAGNLLDHLERKDAELTNLSAQIRYTRVQTIQGDTQSRLGEIFYQRGKALQDGASRRFVIDFKSLIVDGAVRNERTAWGYDGQWLIEKDYETKQYVRRRIAAPGAEIDPLRLGSGSGTIPLPIGQRREDVERYFKAELVGALEGLVPDADALEDDDAGYREFVRTLGGSEGVAGVYQLKLTPLEGTEAAEDYRVIRLWYQKGTLLPMMSRAIDRKGDISTVQLINVDTATPIEASRIDLAPPMPGEGWVEREEDRVFED